jgi:hypothetical protein
MRPATACSPRAARIPEPRPGGGAGKRRILTVVLNTTSMEARANESQKLLNWGFQAFDTMRLFDDGKPIATTHGLEGQEREAKLGAAGAVFVSVPKGEGGKLQTKVERTDPLVAPLAKGQRVGTIKVRRPRARRWPTCRWWCWRRSSRPASSAAPGMRSGCGSSTSSSLQ